MCLCGVGSYVVVLGLSEVVSVPYVGAVTVMRVLLFVLHVSMLRACEGCGNAGVWGRGGVVVVSVGHEYVGGSRGSGIISCSADVLGMSEVRGMR